MSRARNALLLAACLAASAPAQDARTTVRESIVQLPRDDAPVWTLDLDGDGRRELATATAKALHVWPPDDAGRYADDRQLRLAWPAPDLAFDLADLDGDGADDVVGLLGGTQLVRWPAGPDGFGEPEVLRDGLQGAVPRGVHRVPLVRDVDHDGHPDVLVPAAGRFLILRGTDGVLREPFPVDFESKVRVQVGDPRRLDTEFGQDIEVPWFRMRDLDGDGLADLVSETEDHVSVHLATADDLPREPSWTLDLAALRDEVALDSFDLFDLTRNLQSNVNWRIEDVDGEAPLDLVIQQGPTLLIYLGGSRRGMQGKPDDVLPSSGNVLVMALLDVIDDELPELHIVRIEDITLGKLLRMAAFTTETTFHVFSYRNVGGTFERRAYQRRTIDVEIPSFLEMSDEDGDLAKRMEALEDEMEDGPDYRRLCLDGDERFDDLVAVVEGRLRFWRDALPESPFRHAGLNDLQGALVETLEDTDLDGLANFLRKRDGGDVRAEVSHDVSLEELVLSARGVSRKLRPLLGSDFEFEHRAHLRSPGLTIVDLDGDGVSDVLAAGKRRGTEVSIGPRGTRVRDSTVEEGPEHAEEQAEARVIQVLLMVPADAGASDP